jgi:hypothetical protein
MSMGRGGRGRGVLYVPTALSCGREMSPNAAADIVKLLALRQREEKSQPSQEIVRLRALV